MFLENEFLRVGVLPDKGADIFELLYKPTDTEYLLHTPRGIRRPIIQTASGGEMFLDYYEGGWQEILPNGGPSCTYKGVAFGQHDEIALLPWEYHIEADTSAEVQVVFDVRPFHTPFHLVRRMTLREGEPILNIDERLTNEGHETMDFMWGHHPAYGAPFLSSDCHVDLPPGDLILTTFDDEAGTRLAGGQHRWPMASGHNGASVDFSRPDPSGTGQEDLGYVVNLPEAWYAITNQKLQVGLALTWTLDVFPYLWVWRQFNRSEGYPWYGQVYAMALEPWSSYPSAGLMNAIENGTAAKLAAGESVSATVRAMAYSGIQQVSHVLPTGQIVA